MFRRGLSLLERNPMTVLGFNPIEPNISIEKVKRRYLDLAKTYHPDSNMNKLSAAQCATKFSEIKEAYSLIQRNPDRYLLLPSLHHQRELNQRSSPSHPYNYNNSNNMSYKDNNSFFRYHDPRLWGFADESASASYENKPKSSKNEYEELMRYMEESIQRRMAQEAASHHRRKEEDYSRETDEKVRRRLHSLGIDPNSIRKSASSESDLASFLRNFLIASSFLIGIGFLASRQKLVNETRRSTPNEEDLLAMDSLKRYIESEKRQRN